MCSLHQFHIKVFENAFNRASGQTNTKSVCEFHASNTTAFQTV